MKTLSEQIRVRWAARWKFLPRQPDLLRRLPVRKLFFLIAFAAFAGCQTQPEKPIPVVAATGGENDGKHSAHRVAHHAEPIVAEPTNAAPVAPDNSSTNQLSEKSAPLPFPPTSLRSNTADSKNTNGDSKTKISIPATAPTNPVRLTTGNPTFAAKPAAERLSITIPSVAPAAPSVGARLTLAESPLPVAMPASRQSALVLAPPPAGFHPARNPPPVFEVFSRLALSPVAFGFQDRRELLIFSLSGIQMQTAGAPAVSTLCLSNWITAPERPVSPPASHATPDAREALHHHLYQFLLGDHR